MCKLRKEEYRIGNYRGKILYEDDKREYKIQRDLYLIGKVRLIFPNSNKIDVRLFAYEVPLCQEPSRGKCIDLLGYDKDFNIYIFELKRADNSEVLPKVIDQINDYCDKLKQILSHVEREFLEAFLLKNITFGKKRIKKIILAPRRYYEKQSNFNKKYGEEYQGDILFGFFGRISDKGEYKLVKGHKKIVNINFLKKH